MPNLICKRKKTAAGVAQIDPVKAEKKLEIKQEAIVKQDRKKLFKAWNKF